jgi:hypothetical protein
MEMTDYAELADIARARHEAEQHLAVTPLGLKADPKAYFDKVKTLIFTEMNKANVELHRSGAPLFGRNHLPTFDREIFLTFGTDLLCRVSLEVRAGRDFILAVHQRSSEWIRTLAKGISLQQRCILLGDASSGRSGSAGHRNSS